MFLEIEKKLENKISEITSAEDPAHDLLHFKRVVNLAKIICMKEKAKAEIVIPAAWLHDFVIIPKNDPRRKQASQLSADAAIIFLKELSYPEKYFDEISHAIAAHSFSANIEAKTLEAKIVQDADRLDGLGAIGIARCFATAGLLKRPFYSENDPFCNTRTIDDQQFTVDHFYAKLFKTAETLKTNAGREEGLRRVEVMKKYLSDLAYEIQWNSDHPKRELPPEIHTDRLILRPIQASDVEAIFEYCSLPKVSKHTTWEVHKTIDDSMKLVDYAKANYQRGLVEPLAITLKDDKNKLIGTVGWFWNSERYKSIELAYALSPKFWGQGLVLEACKALVNKTLKNNEILRITSRCMSENTSSARVMEKMGMEFEGTQKQLMNVKGRWVDIKNYCILTKNWK